MFTLSFGFYVVNIVTAPFVRPGALRLVEFMLHRGNLDHLAGSLVFGGLWLFVRRRPLSMQTLRLLDLGALVVGCTLFALMGAHLMRLQVMDGLDVATGAYAGLLASANTVMARAIIVPSTPQRTLIGSVAAMAALLPATAVAGGGSDYGGRAEAAIRRMHLLTGHVRLSVDPPELVAAPLERSNRQWL